MINKNLKLARRLRGESIDDLISGELDYVLAELVKEFGTASLGELLFKVVERYHKTLIKSKAKRGPKQKWSPLLCAMIKIEVDARRKPNITLKAVIRELNKESLWKPFLVKEAQFRKVYDQEHDIDSLKYAKYLRPFQDEWAALLKEEAKRFDD